MSGRKAIYQAVFPITTEGDRPTPTATPVVDTGSFDIRGSTSQDHYSNDAAAHRIKWERAWHAATSYLTLDRTSVLLADLVPGNESVLEKTWVRQCTEAVSEAVTFIIQDSAPPSVSKVHDGLRRLIDWYIQEVTSHFIECQLVALTELFKEPVQDGSLPKAVKLLQVMQNIYFLRIDQAIAPYLKDKSQFELRRLRDRYNALVCNSLDANKLSEHLTFYLYSQTRALFTQPSGVSSGEAMKIDEHGDQEDPAASIKKVLLALDDVGLGGTQVQRVLAEVVDDSLSEFVVKECKNKRGGVDPPNALWFQSWVDDWLLPLMLDTVACFRSDDQSTSLSWDQQLPSDIVNWKKRLIQELAALRLHQAFRIVQDWQEKRPSGLTDLIPYTKTVAGRAFLVKKFTAAVGRRLLQPGASTVQILIVYVHIIVSFLELDSKGVLLDRISKPIRRYLRERPDTIKIIIQSLISDPFLPTASEGPIEELARVLNKVQEHQAPEADVDEELYDLNWEPDPIDAAPEYKANGRGEILSSLIDIFENKDVFVKEFQNIFGDSLLQYGHSFYREIEVLELFKKQIGEAPLQACDVMLRDIVDSRRIVDYIKTDQAMRIDEPCLNAKILSRFYWPALQAEDFKVPKNVESVQEKLAAGFEHLKHSRKLEWLNSLGRAKVELQLKDRVVEEEVYTWQASVIYAFAEIEGNRESPVTRSVEEIEDELQMNRDLVKAALSFWVGKMVLRQDGMRYVVLEEMPRKTAMTSPREKQVSESLAADAAAASAAAMAADFDAARRIEEKVEDEKMAVLWQFIQSMLRNQGPMPLPKIVMMLKFAGAEGFPNTTDELKAFLAKRIEAGQLDLAGGKYKVV